jgi:hypothetical protein
MRMPLFDSVDLRGGNFSKLQRCRRLPRNLAFSALRMRSHCIMSTHHCLIAGMLRALNPDPQFDPLVECHAMGLGIWIEIKFRVLLYLGTWLRGGGRHGGVDASDDFPGMARRSSQARLSQALQFLRARPFRCAVECKHHAVLRQIDGGGDKIVVGGQIGSPSEHHPRESRSAYRSVRAQQVAEKS